MKQNREAGEEDEDGAQLAFFLSAEPLTPAAVFLRSFCTFSSIWLGLFCSRHGCCCLLACFTSRGPTGNSVLCRNAGRKDFRWQEIPGKSQLLRWRREVGRQQRVELIRQQARFGTLKQQHDQIRNNIDSFYLLGGVILKAVVKTEHFHQGLYGIRGLTGPTEPFDHFTFWEQNYNLAHCSVFVLFTFEFSVCNL